MLRVRINLKCSPCGILALLNQEATGRGENMKCCSCTRMGQATTASLWLMFGIA